MYVSKEHIFSWSKSCGSCSKEQTWGSINGESHRLRPHVERETFYDWGREAMLLHKNIQNAYSLHSQSKLRKVNQKDRPSLPPCRPVILWETSWWGASARMGAEETQVQIQN